MTLDTISPNWTPEERLFVINHLIIILQEKHPTPPRTYECINTIRFLTVLHSFFLEANRQNIIDIAKGY
jgi:hypothetical protein